MSHFQYMYAEYWTKLAARYFGCKIKQISKPVLKTNITKGIFSFRKGKNKIQRLEPTYRLKVKTIIESH